MAAWLRSKRLESQGVWLVLAKKGTTHPTTLTYDEALDEAICFGWIDGQLGRRDGATFRRRFTPRSARSTWSQRNVTLAERLLAALGPRDPGARALLFASLAEVTDARDWQRRRELADEAVSLANGLDDAAKLDVVLSCYEFRTQPERSGERLAETAWACRVAERLGDPFLRFQACFWRMHSCMDVGDLVEVDQRVEEMGALVDRTGLPHCRWQLLLTRAGRALLGGDLATGERQNDEALAVGSDIGAAEALAVYGGLLFMARLLQGQIDELIEPFAQTAAENPAIPMLRVALAAVYCSLGRLDEATPLFEHDVATGFTEIPREMTWTTAMSHAQECAVALEHREAAAVLYNLILPYGDPLSVRLT